MESCCLRIPLVAILGFVTARSERDTNPIDINLDNVATTIAKKGNASFAGLNRILATGTGIIDTEIRVGDKVILVDDGTAATLRLKQRDIGQVLSIDNTRKFFQHEGFGQYEIQFGDRKVLLNKEEIQKVAPDFLAHGPMYQLWNDFEQVREDAVKSARDWSQNTYEAMKEAHKMMSKPIHYAKNALMRDAMIVNEAIRGEFKDHVAMLDQISLDTHARNKIRSEYGQNVLIPPDEFGQDLKGRKVRCNTRYRGDFATWVHDHPLGKIVDFDTGSDAYRIALDEKQWEGDSRKTPPRREFYLLRKGEFVLLPNTDKTYKGKLFNLSAEQAQSGARHMEQMGFYASNPYVVVDSNPPTWSTELTLSRICKVVDVDQKAGTFFIAPVAITGFSKTTRYDERTYNTDKKLELKAGKDFHTLTSVKDDRVKVNYDNGSGVVMRGVEGRVVGFDPGTMSYTVAVPQVTVPIGQVSRMNRSEKAWHKRGSGVPSQFDKPLVGKHIMMRAGQEWTSGRILGFSPKTEAAATLRDYSYTLLSDNGVQQNNAEWPRDWHEPAGFAQATDVQVGTLSTVFRHASHGKAEAYLETHRTSSRSHFGRDCGEEERDCGCYRGEVWDSCD